MPISLLLRPAIDPSMMQATSSRLVDNLEESGRRGGERFGALFGQGVERSTPKIEAASRRVSAAVDKTADAYGRAHVAQERYDQLVRSGERDRVKLVSSQEALARANRASESSARATASAMAVLDRAQRDAAVSGTAFTELMRGIADGAAGTRIAGMASSVEVLSGRLGAVSGVAGGAALGVAGVGVAAVAVTKQLYDLGAQWDDVADSITGRTGLVGNQLTAITDSVKQVAGRVAVPIEKVGEIAGRVSQSLHLTGQPLEQMTQQISELSNLSGEGVDVRGLGKAFRVFGVTDAAEMTRQIDSLNAVRQATGIGFNDLVSTLTTTGKVAKELGLSLGETAGLISTFEAAGVDAEKTSTGLAFAMKTFAKAGREPQQALRDTITEIKRLLESGNSAAAQTLAVETFGKAWTDFFPVIKSGDLDVQALNKSLGNVTSTVHDQAKATEDAKQAWTKLGNTLRTDFAPIAESVFNVLNRIMTMPVNEDLRDFFHGVPSTAVSAYPDRPGVSPEQLQGLYTGAGNVPGGGPLGALSLIAPPATGPQPGPLPPRPTGPGGGWFPVIHTDVGGIRWYDPEEAKASKHQYVDPSLFQVGGDVGQVGQVSPALPMMSPAIGPSGAYGFMQVDPDRVADANNAVLQQRESLSEANLRLLQIQQDQNADQLTLLTAQNNVAQQKRSLDRAERELMQAQQGTWKKAEDTVKGLTSGMGQIGAALDADFGVSRGLAGIAENLTKFAANVALAPMLGRLAATSAVNPNQGSGLLGSLASQGAFGIQYTPQYANAVSAAAPSVSPALQPVSAPIAPASMLPGAANQGESARSFAHRVMMPFWEAQGLTVGDHAADKYGEHQNGALDIMVASIAEGNSVLQQVLSDSNVYGAIFNNKTYGYGHGLTPRPYGSTGGPTDRHEDHVHAWYKPGGESNIVPASPALTPMSTPASGGGWWPGLNAAAPAGGAGPGAAFPGRVSPPLSRTSGGLAPSAGPGGEGAQGLSGVPMAAMTSAIGMGLDAMAPGAGAAAQTVSQLTNRFVGWMGQNVGIGVGALGETLLPHGSPLADFNRSWLGRFAAGFGGARPAFPNIAGQQSAPPAPPAPPGAADAQGGAGQPQQGQNGQPITLNYNNYQATEQGSGRDMVRILANTGPGR